MEIGQNYFELKRKAKEQKETMGKDRSTEEIIFLTRKRGII